MKILFSISSLSSGGAERVVTTLANTLATTNEVIIATSVSPRSDFYKLNESVKRIHFLKSDKLPQNRFQVFIRIGKIVLEMTRYLRYERPDVVISFIHKMNVMAILSCKIAKVPIICSERSNPKHDKTGSFFDIMRRCLYPIADMNVFQTLGARRCFPKIPNNKCMIIRNPLPVIPPLINCERERTILGMGRLVELKGFDRLINAVDSIQDLIREKKWRVDIYGDGDLREELTTMICKKGLSDIITLYNGTKNPFRVMSFSSIFIMSSDYEGYPNVLCEAMACGCIPISVDCDFGPKEIIKNGKNGLLVNISPEAIASGIVKIINNETDIGKMRKSALKIRDYLDVKKISREWENVINRVVQ